MSTTIYVLSRNKKNNVYPCKPQFYYIKWGLRGSKLYRYVFVMIWIWATNWQFCWTSVIIVEVLFCSQLFYWICAVLFRHCIFPLHVFFRYFLKAVLRDCNLYCMTSVKFFLSTWAYMKWDICHKTTFSVSGRLCFAGVAFLRYLPLYCFK